ncbi:unnamed protein product, partial [Candidula unifasciata]
WHKELSADVGYIQSQAFPNQYPDYVNYTWTVVGKPGTVVSLRFSKFYVDASSKCYQDSVEIYDDSKNSSRLIGQYCGDNIPGLLRTRTERMRIHFKTDNGNHDNEAIGFNATYNSH